MNDLLIGRRFICPQWSYDSPHIGVVISEKDYDIKCWLYCQHLLTFYLTKLSVRKLLERTLPSSVAVKSFAPVAALAIWAFLLLIALLCFALYPGLRWAALLLVVWHLVDSLFYNTSVAFVTQQPKLPLRSAILGGIAFLELSLAFAVLYLLLPKEAMNVDLNWLTAWYFSLVTIVTLGYGDVHPCSQLA